MRVLVTGANGFLGSALVRRLVSDGASVRVLVRSPERADALRHAGAEVVIGDVTMPDSLAPAVDGIGVVYHFAGRLLKPGVGAAEYRAVHVTGTSNVLAALEANRSLERLVHCSTTGVLGVTGPEPADEETPTRPTNVYEETKAEAEAEVRAAITAGLPAVIVRPGLVYGPGDVHLAGFFRSIQRGQFRPIGRETVWMHPIYIDDLVEGIRAAGTVSQAIGECFHLAAPRPVTLDEFAAAIARAEGRAPTSGRIPIAAARAVAAVGDRLPVGMRARAPLTSSRLDFLTHSRVYDVSKARRILGFVAPTDLATGLARTVAWYRAEGHLAARAAA